MRSEICAEAERREEKEGKGRGLEEKGRTRDEVGNRTGIAMDWLKTVNFSNMNFAFALFVCNNNNNINSNNSSKLFARMKMYDSAIERVYIQLWHG